MSSSKAEYLCLPLEAAEIDVGADEGLVLVGTGDGGRLMAGWSLLFLLLPLSLLLSSSKLISVPCSRSFPFPFALPRTLPLPLPLPDKAGMFEAAPRDCCEGRKACVPFTVLGMISAMR
jgi:hypothetical protein